MRMGALYRGGQCVVPRVYLADTPWTRARGLLGRLALAGDAEEAILLRPCAAVHTLGMRYALDVVFLDARGAVLKAYEQVRPGTIRFCRGARETLELSAGGLMRLRPEAGEVLSWRAE